MGFFDRLLGRSGQLKGRAGQYASEHNDTIARGLDRAGQAANKATKGRFESQIDKARGAAKRGVDSLGEQSGATGGGPTGGPEGGAPPPPPPPPGGPPPGGRTG